MSSGIGSLHAVVLDVTDLASSVPFWLAVTGGEVSFADDRYARIAIDGATLSLLLQRVPEGKSVKNRMHLDFEVGDLDRAVSAAVTAGARSLARVAEYGIEWEVMADPDGNEFCLIGSPT